MAIGKSLATLFVDFVTRGVDKVTEACAASKKHLDDMTGSAKAFGKEADRAFSTFVETVRTASGHTMDIYKPLMEKMKEEPPEGGGFDKARDAVDKLRVGTVAAGVVIGNVFSSALNKIGDFVRAGIAGTVMGEALNIRMQLLSRNIAGLFQPELRKLIDLLDRTVAWFRALTNEQRTNIVKWIEAAVATSAVALILPKVIGLVGGLVIGMKTLTAAMLGFDVASGGILPAIGAIVTAFVAMATWATVSKGGVSELGTVFKEMAKPIMDIAAKQLPRLEAAVARLALSWQVVKPAWEGFFNWAGNRLDNLVWTWARASAAIVGFGTLAVTGSLAAAREASGEEFKDIMNPRKPGGADKGGRTETQPARAGFEGLNDTMRRIQVAALNQDFDRQTANNTKAIAVDVNEIKKGIAAAMANFGRPKPGLQLVP